MIRVAMEFAAAAWVGRNKVSSPPHFLFLLLQMPISRIPKTIWKNYLGVKKVGSVFHSNSTATLQNCEVPCCLALTHPLCQLLPATKKCRLGKAGSSPRVTYSPQLPSLLTPFPLGDTWGTHPACLPQIMLLAVDGRSESKVGTDTALLSWWPLTLKLLPPNSATASTCPMDPIHEGDLQSRSSQSMARIWHPCHRPGEKGWACRTRKDYFLEALQIFWKRGKYL